MRRVQSASLTVAATLAAVASSAAPATAAPVATIWPGWESVGPAPGIDAQSALEASGSTVFVVRGTSADYGREGVGHPFVVDAGGTQRVGTLTFVAGGRPNIAVPAPTRLIAKSGCEIQRSDDTGASWATVLLPDCDVARSSNDSGELTFSDADHGFAITLGRVYSTADGGRSWTPTGTVPSATSGIAGTVAIGPTTMVRSELTALRRSEDGGATWKVVPLPAAGGMLTTALPSVGLAVRRADGVVLVGVRGAVLRSTDQGRTFTRTDAPTPPELAGASDLDVPTIACDPQNACIADIDDPGVSTRHQGLRYADSGFGAAVPGLPRQATSPAPRTVVGLQDLPLATALVRSTDAGATYAPLITGSTTLGSLGGDGLLSVLRGDRVSMSVDRGEVFTDAPLPGPSPIVEDIAAPGGTLALTTDGHIQRLVNGAWQLVADATPIKPKALAVAGDVPVVVGSRGVAVVAKAPAVTLASAPALAGRGFVGVTARGRTILIWSGSRLVRSADGGRHWKAQRLPGRIEDVRIVDRRFVFAIAGGRLVTSRNAGVRFKGVGYPIPLGDGSRITTAAFRDARNGVTTGSGGLQITTDGGRTFRPVPTPGGTKPVFADSTGGGVLVQDRLSGDLYRFLTASKAPSARIALKRTGALAPRRARTTGTGAKKRAVASKVRVVGRITGVPINGTVSFVTTGARGVLSDAGSAAVNADGSFLKVLKIGGSDRTVRAWYGGAVLPSGTIGGSASPVVRVRR